MAVIGLAQRRVLIYQLENQPQEFKNTESPLKYMVRSKLNVQMIAAPKRLTYMHRVDVTSLLINYLIAGYSLTRFCVYICMCGFSIAASRFSPTRKPPSPLAMLLVPSRAVWPFSTSTRSTPKTTSPLNATDQTPQWVATRKSSR